jgi:hypothetical protein
MEKTQVRRTLSVYDGQDFLGVIIEQRHNCRLSWAVAISTFGIRMRTSP